MAWGFNPYLMEAEPLSPAPTWRSSSPSARLVAAGFEHRDVYLTFQEYFEKLARRARALGQAHGRRCSAPLMAQVDLGIGCHRRQGLHVRQLRGPRRAAHARVASPVAVGHVGRVTSPEFKGAGHQVIAVAAELRRRRHHAARPSRCWPPTTWSRASWARGQALAVSTPGYGGVAEALFKMCVGNQHRRRARRPTSPPRRCSAPPTAASSSSSPTTRSSPSRARASRSRCWAPPPRPTSSRPAARRIDLSSLQEAWEARHRARLPVPQRRGRPGPGSSTTASPSKRLPRPAGDPRRAARASLIPVFPGTNCEYDTARAFARAGAEPDDPRDQQPHARGRRREHPRARRAASARARSS